MPSQLQAMPTVTRAHAMPFGTAIEPGGVHFRLWAPAAEHVDLAIEGGDVLRMHKGKDGFHELLTAQASAGTQYRFVLPDGLRVPDPASRHQPHDLHGPSEVIDPAAFPWSDADWPGQPWHETVLYELHIGAFTPEGTFQAAIGKLDHLVSLGVTTIEIMPVGDFPGGWDWGYDGALLYAPDSTYGRPEDMKAFVQAAHGRGLSVMLDVVYNHFGPDGNYMAAYAPIIYTKRHKTPWGDAINFDSRQSVPVREFIIHNALYWIEEFHLDGLRLDAVHAIKDDSQKHLLHDLAERARALAHPCPLHLVLENEENCAALLERAPDGTPLLYTAQWNDDVHHVLHVAATGEATGYYAEYHGQTPLLGRALAQGFAFQGDMMEYRGEPRGEPSGHLPPDAFIGFIQNHDHIGNRAFGDRIAMGTAPDAVRATATAYLLLPQVPMLFMGEEWAAAQPFPFFCDFSGELADSVRTGRHLEFARFPEFADEAARARIPDPGAASTFQSSKLDWDRVRDEPHAGWLAWYSRILAVRRTEIMPLIPRMHPNEARFDIVGPGAVTVRWRLNGGGELALDANLSGGSATLPAQHGRTLWQEGDLAEDGACGPWAVRWSLHG